LLVSVAIKVKVMPVQIQKIGLNELENRYFYPSTWQQNTSIGEVSSQVSGPDDLERAESNQAVCWVISFKMNCATAPSVAFM
jgi:hypothetical protein